MSLQTWQETIITAQVDGATLSASTAATSILPAAAKITLPNNYFSFIGKRMRITGFAALSNIVTTPGTLTLDIRFGATVVFNGGAMQMSTTAHTTVPIMWEILLTCRAIGTSANLMGQGVAFSQALNISSSDSTTTHTTLLMPNTIPSVGNNFDSTATQQIDMFATFSVNNAGNAITVKDFGIESLN